MENKGCHYYLKPNKPGECGQHTSIRNVLVFGVKNVIVTGSCVNFSRNVCISLHQPAMLVVWINYTRWYRLVCTLKLALVHQLGVSVNYKRKSNKYFVHKCVCVYITWIEVIPSWETASRTLWLVIEALIGKCVQTCHLPAFTFRGLSHIHLKSLQHPSNEAFLDFLKNL